MIKKIMKRVTIGENILLLILLSSFCFIATYARNAKDESCCDRDTEYWNDCGVLPSCERTCTKESQVCAKICSPGCFCKKPLIRKYTNSTVCIEESKCNNKTY